MKPRKGRKSRKPESSCRTFVEWLDEIDRRRRLLFSKPVMTVKEVQEFDRWLASEGREI